MSSVPTRGKRQRLDGYTERKKEKEAAAVAFTPTTNIIKKSSETSKATRAKGPPRTSSRATGGAGAGRNGNTTKKNKNSAGVDAETSVSSSIGTTKSFGSSQTDFTLTSPVNRVRPAVVVQHNGRTLSSTFLNIRDGYENDDDCEDEAEQGECAGVGVDVDADQVLEDSSEFPHPGSPMFESSSHRRVSMDDGSNSDGDDNSSTMISLDSSVSSLHHHHHPPRESSASTSSSSRGDIPPSAPVRSPESIGRKFRPAQYRRGSSSGQSAGYDSSNNNGSVSANSSHSTSSAITMEVKEKIPKSAHHDDDTDAPSSKHSISPAKRKQASNSLTTSPMTKAAGVKEKVLEESEVTNTKKKGKANRGPLKKFKRATGVDKDQNRDNGMASSSHNPKLSQHSVAASSFAPSFGSMSLGGGDDSDEDSFCNSPEIVDVPKSERNQSSPTKKVHHEPPSPLVSPSRPILKKDEETIKKEEEEKKQVKKGIPFSVQHFHKHSPVSRFVASDSSDDDDSDDDDSCSDKRSLPFELPVHTSLIRVPVKHLDPKSPPGRTLSNDAFSTSEGLWSVSTGSHQVPEEDSNSQQQQNNGRHRDTTGSSRDTNIHSNGSWTNSFSDPKEASNHWASLVGITAAGQTDLSAWQSDDSDEDTEEDEEEKIVFTSSGGEARGGPLQNDRRKKIRPRISNWKSPLEFESEDEEENGGKKKHDESAFPALPPTNTKDGKPRSAYDKNAEWYCGEDGEDDVDNDASYNSDGSSVLSAFRPAAKKSPVPAPVVPQSEASMDFGALIGHDGGGLPPFSDLPSEEKSMGGMSFLQQKAEKSTKDESMLIPSPLLSRSNEIDDDDEIQFLSVKDLVSARAVDKKQDNAKKEKRKQPKKHKPNKDKGRSEKGRDRDRQKMVKRSKSKGKKNKSKSTGRDQSFVDVEAGYDRDHTHSIELEEDHDMEQIPVIVSSTIDDDVDEVCNVERNQEQEKMTTLQLIFKYLPWIMAVFGIFVVVDIILVAVFLSRRE
jgi:hypothetical protein